MPSLAEILKQKGQTAPSEKKAEFRIKMIHYSKLIQSKDNFYSTESIETLADILLLAGEVKQNLLVRKADGDKYEIIAGDRRHLAAIFNVKRGHKKFEFLPCKEESRDDILTEFNLITTNSTQRNRSEYEKMQEAIRLKEIIPQLAGDENLKGRVLREIVAQELNTSETKVAQYEAINNNLVSEGKEKFEAGEIGITTAYELSGLPKKQQEAILDKPEIPPAKDIKALKEKEPLNDAELKAILEISGRDERIIDVLTYNNSKTEKTEGIKSIFGNSGGGRSDYSYSFNYSGKIKIQAEAFDQREITWAEFVDILINLFDKGELKTRLPISRPSPMEELYIVDAIKHYEHPDKARAINTLITAYEVAGDIPEEIQALKDFIFFVPGRKESVYKYRQLIFEDDQIKYYHNDFTDEPKRILPWEELANIFGKALEREWIKLVSEPDTKPVNISTSEDSAGQENIENYEPEESTAGTILEFIQTANIIPLAKWLNNYFPCPPCENCQRQQEPIPETEEQEQACCTEHWKQWLLSQKDETP